MYVLNFLLILIIVALSLTWISILSRTARRRERHDVEFLDGIRKAESKANPKRREASMK
jgi:hypothetical protein